MNSSGNQTVQKGVQKLKVGFAFSGASSRSTFYIGFLEVLEEHNFPIDYIASMSGAAIVASSYACGTLPQLKKMALSLNTELVFNLIERSKGAGGLYHMKKVEEYLRLYTQNKTFEEVTPALGVIATDINAGEEINLQVGDIAKAVCASSTLPGLFQPIPWGDKSLIDGGVFNIVPGKVAAQSGVDVVIGVDMRGVRHVFSPWQISLKRIMNEIKAFIWPNSINRLWKNFIEHFAGIQFLGFYPDINTGYDQRKNKPRLFQVLGRSLDLAIAAQEKDKPEDEFGCDMLIVPEAKKQSFWNKYFFLHFTDFSHTKEYYRLGRKTAEEQLPKMWQLLADTSEQIEHNTKQVEKLLTEQKV